MTAIIGSYEGSNPWNGNMLYREMMGQEAAGTTLFTGQDTWTDYVGSASWAASTTMSIGAQKLWSIPLFANSSSLKEAATGADDKYFAQVAKSLLASQASGSIYVRTGWEFNGGWETWAAGSDPADYIKAYQQFVDAFRSVSNRFVFTWSPAEATGGMNPAAAYPGNAYVDIIGLDVYDNNTYDGNNATAAFNNKVNAEYGLNWLANFAAQNGKQLAIPEWGVNNNNDAAFVTLMANWIKTHNVAYASYWDADAGGFNGLLSGMPAVEAAYIAAFGPSATTPAAATSLTTTTHKAVSDLDGDHKSDIVLFNSTTHTVSEITSGSGDLASKASTLGSVGSHSSVIGVADFDGDGKADILWLDSYTRDVQLWESGQGMQAHPIDLSTVGVNMSAVGVGDFDGDGKSDVVWENTVTDDVQLWLSSKGLGAKYAVDLGATGPHSSVVGVGDFDGDGKADILWFDNYNHDVQLWESTNGMRAGAIDLGTVGANVTAVGVGDFDGEGKADVLWFNSSTHDLLLWESSKGLSSKTAVDLGTVGSQWTPIAVGDYDGDGKADILFENSATHDLQIWESSLGLNATHAVDVGVLSSGLALATGHLG